MNKFAWAIALAIYAGSPLFGQDMKTLELSSLAGLTVSGFQTVSGERTSLQQGLPFVSFLVNDTLAYSSSASARQEGDSVVFTLVQGIKGWVKQDPGNTRGWKGLLTLQNVRHDTVTLANVVPLGEGPEKYYITATGPADFVHRLSRSALFRPGFGPVGVVLPDNAWEMGFCDAAATSDRRLVAIARRSGSTLAQERRFRTIIAPGGTVQYAVFADVHPGGWHEGLRLMYHDRWIYDLESFSDSLFSRRDLEWVRHSYLTTILMAWDYDYYDRFKGEYGLGDILTRQRQTLGPYDAFMIWPTWPRLGVDQRNQFDLYQDMPGGLKEIRRQVDMLHRDGKKYFVSYNPWDESTRNEDHLKGMKDLLRETDADGVVLDTWGNSTREFQRAADSVKPGVVMYSEGMAVPADMPLIVAGRVHDAIYLPPPLNMNKVIKPEFAIFRVMQVREGRLHREGAVCLFNGYGFELNVMGPGRPDWMDAEYAYLGRIVRTLREHSNEFLSPDWLPLLPTRVDSVWVNRWPGREKTVYTVLGLRPQGFRGPLFEAPVDPSRHYVSVWNHEELDPVSIQGSSYIPANVEGFSASWLDSRREGNVDCIAWFPKLLDIRRLADSLFVTAPRGDSIRITAGDPSYANEGRVFSAGVHAMSLHHVFGRYEGKFVIQLYAGGELIDERTTTVPLATPRLISKGETTPRTATAPAGMNEIPGGEFVFSTAAHEEGEPFVANPDFSRPRTMTMGRYYMDTYPVTNREFKKFLDAAKYRPADPVNFLRHWKNGKIPAGQESHPVIWVNIDDARAYARWAGKRLPTSLEWQYAAQGNDGRLYPWGTQFDSTKCNYKLNETTPVDRYPAGGGPFGTKDLVGNVWQMTADVYDNISYYFQMLRGGSYFSPSSSIWYVKGGPWRVNEEQLLLLVSPGFDRNATIGFRCVKDAK